MNQRKCRRLPPRMAAIFLVLFLLFQGAHHRSAGEQREPAHRAWDAALHIGSDGINLTMGADR